MSSTHKIFLGTTGMSGERKYGYMSGYIHPNRITDEQYDNLSDYGFTVEQVQPISVLKNLGWLPITSAPKNGRFLLANFDGFAIKSVRSGYRDEHYRGDAWLTDTNNRCSDDGFTPTHYVSIHAVHAMFARGDHKDINIEDALNALIPD